MVILIVSLPPVLWRDRELVIFINISPITWTSRYQLSQLLVLVEGERTTPPPDWLTDPHCIVFNQKYSLNAETVIPGLRFQLDWWCLLPCNFSYIYLLSGAELSAGISKLSHYNKAAEVLQLCIGARPGLRIIAGQWRQAFLIKTWAWSL